MFHGGRSKSSSSSTVASLLHVHYFVLAGSRDEYETGTSLRSTGEESNNFKEEFAILSGPIIRNAVVKYTFISDLVTPAHFLLIYTISNV